MNQGIISGLHRDLTDKILGSAVEVHRHLGPGLLESAYRSCLVRDLELNGIAVKQEEPIPIEYKGLILESGYRADLIVESSVLIELKSVEKLASIHEAQMLTYLRLAHIRVGLLLNFNVTSLRRGIVRLMR